MVRAAPPVTPPELGPDVDAIRSGAAFTDLSDRRKILVTGDDATGWLNDLLTADIDGLHAGRAAIALLLSPTGRIRAVVTAAPIPDGILLVQDRAQPDPIDGLLERYVLSSNVHLRDVTTGYGLLAVSSPAPAATWTPSALAWPGDILVPAADLDRLSDELRADGLREVPPEAVERWRIAEGLARFPADLATDSLPHEAAFDDAIDDEKGCYLGQEAVARVRNLGHPPRFLRAFTADGPVQAGDELASDGEAAGIVTSAAAVDEARVAGIARVRWALRDAGVTVPSGAALTPGPRVRGLA